MIFCMHSPWVNTYFVLKFGVANCKIDRVAKCSIFATLVLNYSVPMGQIDLIPLLGDRSWPWLSVYEVSSIFVGWFGHNLFDKCNC